VLKAGELVLGRQRAAKALAHALEGGRRPGRPTIAVAAVAAAAIIPADERAQEPPVGRVVGVGRPHRPRHTLLDDRPVRNRAQDAADEHAARGGGGGFRLVGEVHIVKDLSLGGERVGTPPTAGAVGGRPQGEGVDGRRQLKGRVRPHPPPRPPPPLGPARRRRVATGSRRRRGGQRVNAPAAWWRVALGSGGSGSGVGRVEAVGRVAAAADDFDGGAEFGLPKVGVDAPEADEEQHGGGARAGGGERLFLRCTVRSSNNDNNLVRGASGWMMGGPAQRAAVPLPRRAGRIPETYRVSEGPRRRHRVGCASKSCL